MNKGLFITFEGIDGAGKSTQIAFLKDYLESLGKNVILTREPGGTEIGNKIRGILLDKNNAALCSMAELLLYYADRAQHVSEQILPALEDGVFVICDRFYDSSFAYQKAGRGIDSSILMQLNEMTVKEAEPDLTFILDLPTKLSDERVRSRGEELDRLELESFTFKENVRQGFLDQAKNYPERITVLNALDSKEAIFKIIKLAVSEKINGI